MVLRGPLMSFGGIQVDGFFPSDELPSRSMLTGLLGAAMGVRRAEGGRLNALAARISYVARTPGGQRIVDFHTADLSKPYMSDEGAWDPGGKRIKRHGSVTKSTVIQRKEYIADTQVTVGLKLSAPGIAPGPTTREDRAWAAEVTPATIVAALQRPSWPLSIGRRSCIPSRPPLEAVTSAPLMDVLELRGSRERTLGGYEVPDTIVWRDRGRQKCKILKTDNTGFEHGSRITSVAMVGRAREAERDFVRQVGVSVLKAGVGEVDTTEIWA
jgi:CRISPR system Cascade subunit CasD